MLKTLSRVLAPLLTILLSACSVFGTAGVKEPRHKTILTDGKISIRQYAPVMLAQVSSSSEGDTSTNPEFRALFRYISGDNRQNAKIKMTAPVINQSEKIKMTAPVITSTAPQNMTMAFFLPQKYNAGNAPQPTNRKIKLVSRPAMTMAVIRFSGSTSKLRVKQMTDKLTAWIKQSRYKITGPAVVAMYNPPWTLPMLKRNEIQIPVSKK